MPTESLILRRVYPVPVTFADLRRAAMSGDLRPWPSTKRLERVQNSTVSDTICSVRTNWHAALKEATGALDEVYAVIDGREVLVATVGKTSTGYTIEGNLAARRLRALHDIMEVADEAGYWQHPHEVIHVLSERPVSFSAVERAVNVGWCAKGGVS